MPEGCTLAKVVKIAYTASVTTAEVLNGCNPLLGTTGAAGAAPITLFDFPKPTLQELSSSGRKRKRATAAASVQSTSTPAGDNPEEGEAEHEAEPEGGPSVTISHDRQLKKAENQCFCGKGDFNTTEELNKHKQDVHIQKGSAKNPKTGEPLDSWDCSQCGEKCSDNRACWRHSEPNTWVFTSITAQSLVVAKGMTKRTP